MESALQQSRRSPVWVWIISAFYLISAGYPLLSFALLFSGQVKPDAAQEAYFASLTSVDWFFTFSIGLLSIAGAISLFLLRRRAVILFATSLAISFAFTAFQLLRTNWIEVTGVSGLSGMLIAWLISIAVIRYARHLTKSGVLH